MRSNSHSNRRNAQGGFFVLEFGTASGIIAILIGLLLPAVQKARIEHNEAQAKAGLALAAQEAVNHYRIHGKYPSSLGFSYVDKTTGVLKKGTVAFGYRMGWVDNGATMTLTAEPFSPGTTGNAYMTYKLEDVIVTSYSQTSAARTETVDKNETITIHGAEALRSIQPPTVNWMALLPYMEQDNLYRQASQVMGNFIGTDGTMNFASTGSRVATGDINGDGIPDISTAFWDGIARTFELGAGNEDLSGGGIRSLPSREQWQATPFSYTAMRAIALKLGSITDGTNTTLALAEMKAAFTYDAAGNRLMEQKHLDSAEKALGSLMATFRGQTLKMIMDAQAAGYSQAGVDARIIW